MSKVVSRIINVILPLFRFYIFSYEITLAEKSLFKRVRIRGKHSTFFILLDSSNERREGFASAGTISVSSIYPRIFIPFDVSFFGFQISLFVKQNNMWLNFHLKCAMDISILHFNRDKEYSLLTSNSWKIFVEILIHWYARLIGKNNMSKP